MQPNDDAALRRAIGHAYGLAVLECLHQLVAEGATAQRKEVMRDDLGQRDLEIAQAGRRESRGAPALPDFPMTR